MAVDESRMGRLRVYSTVAAIIGALFGTMGILLLYSTIYYTFPDAPTRLGWWAAISLALSFVFLIGYFVVRDAIGSLEREQRRRISEK